MGAGLPCFAYNDVSHSLQPLSGPDAAPAAPAASHYALVSAVDDSGERTLLRYASWAAVEISRASAPATA